MSTSTRIAIAAPALRPNLPPLDRFARSLARPPETEKEMWRSYLIAAGAAIGLIAVWAVLVSFVT